MLRKAYAERDMVTNGWVSLDPADTGIIERSTRRPSAKARKGSRWRCWKLSLKISEVRPCTEAQREEVISTSGGVVLREGSDELFCFENIGETRAPSRPHTEGLANYREPLSSVLRPDFPRRHTKGDLSRSCWRPGTVFVLAR